jgi:anti-sigma regulatory factor (Ser/Thr protein kinase)
MDEFRAQYRSTYASVRVARRALVSFVRAHGLCGQAVEDFEIAIGEALANAAEHGHVEGATFQVHARVETGGALTVEVKDDGPGFAGWNDASFVKPASSAPRGLGIVIMRKLMDRVEYADGGTCVRLFKQFDPAAFEDVQQEA